MTKPPSIAVNDPELERSLVAATDEAIRQGERAERARNIARGSIVPAEDRVADSLDRWIAAAGLGVFPLEGPAGPTRYGKVVAPDWLTAPRAYRSLRIARPARTHRKRRRREYFQ